MTFNIFRIVIKFRIFQIVLGIWIGCTLLGCQKDKYRYHEISEIVVNIERNLNINVEELLKLPKHFKDEMINIGLVQDPGVKEIHTVLDEKMQEIAVFLQAAYAINKKTARKLLEDINENYKLASNDICLYLYLNSLVSEEVNKTILEQLTNQKIEELTISQVYFLLKALMEYGSNPFNNLQFHLKMSLFHYGLQLIEEHPGPDVFANLKGLLLLKKANLLLGESEEYEPYSIDLLKEARIVFHSTEHQAYITLCSWHLEQLSDSEPTNLLHSKLSVSDLSRRSKIGEILHIGIYYTENENYTEASTYYDMALKLLDGNHCNYYHSIILNTHGYSAFQKGDTTESIKLFNLAQNTNGCTEKDSMITTFLNLKLQKPVFNSLSATNLAHANYATLLEENEIARLLLENDKIHYNDYLSELSVRIFANFDSLYVFDIELINQLINHSYQSKDRNLQDIRIKDEIESKSKVNIQALFKEIDDFKSLDYSNDAYRKILKELVERHGKNEYFIPPLVDKDYLPTLTALDKQQAQLIGFNSFMDLNYGFLYKNESLQIFQLDTDILDTLKIQFYDKVEAKADATEEIDSLRTLLDKQYKIDETRPIIISPDGIPALLPWHLIYPEAKNLIISKDIYDIDLTDSIEVKRSATSIFCYSDTSTFDLPSAPGRNELRHAHKECLAIHEQLQLDENQLYTGSEFTLDNLEPELPNNLIHFSTHAYSSKKERYKNYLVLRDKNGNSTELYYDQIEQWKKTPKVVFLIACGTDVGLQRDGAGTYSLANAFASAGTKTIVKTLWNIDDEDSSQFMSELYKNWTSGNSKRTLGEAFWETRRDFIGSQNYSWAGFALEGNPNVYWSN